MTAGRDDIHQRTQPLAHPERVTEADFQRLLVELAQLRGWKVQHTRPAQNSRGRWSTPIQGDAGFPDLVLARNGVVIVLELKSEKGRLSASQREWLEALGWDGQEDGSHTNTRLAVKVARPSDWQAVANWIW